MAPSGETSAENVREKMISQIVEWHQSAVQASTVKQKSVFLGQIIHLITDSYTPSHAKRNDAGEITRFQDYGAQDSEKHKVADKLKKNFPQLFKKAILASQKYVTALSENWTERELKELLRTEVFNLANDAQAGETEPEYAPDANNNMEQPKSITKSSFSDLPQFDIKNILLNMLPRFELSKPIL